MPEIWLRYGTTDVVLDIRFENLANQISSSFQALAEEEVKAAIGGVPVTDNMLVLALSASKATAKAAAMLAEAARAKGFANVTVDVPARMAGALRTNLTAAAGGELVSINRIDYQSPLQERISKFQSAVIVSSVAYDLSQRAQLALELCPHCQGGWLGDTACGKPRRNRQQGAPDVHRGKAQARAAASKPIHRWAGAPAVHRRIAPKVRARARVDASPLLRQNQARLCHVCRNEGHP